MQNSRVLFMVAAAMTAGGSLSGCAASQQLEAIPARQPSQTQDANDKKATQEIYSMFKKPRTLLGLVANLKVAWDRDFLLKDDFYTDENLRNFSGANEIIWIDNRPSRRYAGATGFNGMLTPIKVGNITYEGINFTVGKIILGTGQISGNAAISFMGYNSDVSFERIEELLGKSWQKAPWVMPPPGRIFKPPTHPHGNDKLRYVHDDGHVKRSIVMEFHEDGTLYSATFLEETNQ